MPLVVSGRDEAALRSQAGRWSEWLGSHPQADLAAVVRTAAVNRTHFDARAAVQADDIGQAQEALDALAQGRAHPAVSTGTARLLGGVVFVFPGQGSQWPGMGRALLAESAVFADAIAACDAALLPHTGWSVRAVLGGDDGEEVPPLDRVDVVQPVLFAMAIGLAAVWRSLGVRPDAVIGHSQGEIAAAVVAGALSLEDGARIAAVRSKLVRQACGWRGDGRCRVAGGCGGRVAGAGRARAFDSGSQHADVDGGFGGPRGDRTVRRPPHGRGGVLPSGGCGLRLAQRAGGRHPRGVEGSSARSAAPGGLDRDALDGDGRTAGGNGARCGVLVS